MLHIYPEPCLTQTSLHLQSDSRGDINILEGDSISPCEKKVHTDMCLIRNGY